MNVDGDGASARISTKLERQRREREKHWPNYKDNGQQASNNIDDVQNKIINRNNDNRASNNNNNKNMGRARRMPMRRA